MFTEKLKSKLIKLGEKRILKDPREPSLDLIAHASMTDFLIEMIKESNKIGFKLGNLRWSYGGVRDEKAKPDSPPMNFETGRFLLQFKFRADGKTARLVFRGDVEVHGEIVNLESHWE